MGFGGVSQGWQAVGAGGGGGGSATSLNWVSKTAAYPIVNADSGTIFDNAGAVGSVTLTLPSGTGPSGGKTNMYGFFVSAAQPLVVKASGADVISLGTGIVSSAGGTITSNATVGTEIMWLANSASGVWSLVGGLAGTWAAA